MYCLLCGLNPVSPDTEAGLCYSCKCGVKNRQWLPVSDETGAVRLAMARATPGNPLGYEGEGRLPEFDWLPESLFPDGAEAGELNEVRRELVSLSTGYAFTGAKYAERLLAEVRALGLVASMDVQHGRATLSDPRACPYPLLCEWVRLLPFVEDVLTREDSLRIREAEEERRRREFGLGVTYGDQ